LRAGASVTEIRGLPSRGRQLGNPRQLWEAPVFTERTSVGLDVHARSVAAAAIDGVTGELVQAKLTPSYDHIRSWVGDLPGPVAVAGEEGVPVESGVRDWSAVDRRFPGRVCRFGAPFRKRRKERGPHHRNRWCGPRPREEPVDSEDGAVQAKRSISMAIPCPPPTHIVSSPMVLSSARRLLMRVPVIRTPVMPNG